MFRPFTGLMVLTAIVMSRFRSWSMSIPMPAVECRFWSFGLMAIGLVACALAYTIFLDGFAPPGAADPFERYRKGW